MPGVMLWPYAWKGDDMWKLWETNKQRLSLEFCIQRLEKLVVECDWVLTWELRLTFIL